MFETVFNCIHAVGNTRRKFNRCTITWANFSGYAYMAFSAKVACYGKYFIINNYI